MNVAMDRFRCSIDDCMGQVWPCRAFLTSWRAGERRARHPHQRDNICCCGSCWLLHLPLLPVVPRADVCPLLHFSACPSIRPSVCLFTLQRCLPTTTTCMHVCIINVAQSVWCVKNRCCHNEVTDRRAWGPHRSTPTDGCPVLWCHYRY